MGTNIKETLGKEGGEPHLASNIRFNSEDWRGFAERREFISETLLHRDEG
jgi:hypothetical protein